MDEYDSSPYLADSENQAIPALWDFGYYPEEEQTTKTGLINSLIGREGDRNDLSI